MFNNIMSFCKNILSILLSLFGFVKPVNRILIRGKTEYIDNIYVTRNGRFETRTVVGNNTHLLKYSQCWIPDLTIKSVILITYFRKSEISNAVFRNILKKSIYTHTPFFNWYNALIPNGINTKLSKKIHCTSVEYKILDATSVFGVKVIKI